MEIYLPLTAFMDPGEMAMMIPLTALMIPIILILVKHQQRMTEIIHSGTNQQTQAEILQLRAEVQEMKQLLHQQMIAVDSMVSTPVRRAEPTVQQRLEQV